MRSKVFIGSSVEGLNIAYAIQQNLRHNAETTVWDQGVFELSNTTIESLIEVLETSDFGIFVFSPDDLVRIRDTESLAVRDNVIFELGLFIGRLGRKRSFIIVPEGIDFRLPTDLLGITPGKYETNRSDGSYQAATGATCHQIRLTIEKHGPRFSSEPNDKPEEAIDTKSEQPNDLKWIDLYIDRKYDESIEELEKVLRREKDPERKLDLNLWLAEINWIVNPNKGNQLFRKHIDDNPNSHETYVKYFYTFLWHDLYNEALAIIEEGINKFPNAKGVFIPKKALCYQKIGENDLAIDLLKSQIKVESSVEIYLSLIEIFYNNNDLATAHRWVNESYFKFPNNEKILSKYCKIASDLELHKVALFLYDKLLSLNNESQDYWTLFGNTCLSLNLINIAMEAYYKGSELSGGKAAWILGNIGNLYNNVGLYEKAINFLEQAIERDKSSQYAHDRLSSTIKNKNNEYTKKQDFIKEGRIELRNLKFTDVSSEGA